jgi:cell division protein FtsB
LSQVTSTFWDDLVDRTGIGVRVRPVAETTARVRPAVKRRVRAQRLIDGVVLTIILAAAATCVSIYTHARAELGGALIKHTAATEKLQDLTINVETLERDVQRLRTDSRFIEHVARQKFGFVRSGEVVIKVAQDQKEVAGATTVARPIRVATVTTHSGDTHSADSYANASN